MTDNLLFYGDNLDVLPSIANDSADMIYLDPPFNSKRAYNVLFHSENGTDSAAQIQAFDDTWHWSPASDESLSQLIGGGSPAAVADTLTAMRHVLGTSDTMAYLVMMTPRLLQLWRVLKSEGSIYLHCDPTASHYLKMLMDAVFGAGNFRNEIIWRRTGAHGPRRSFGPIHDTILFYSKTDDYFFDVVLQPYMLGHVERRYTKDKEGRLKFTSGGNVLTGAGATGGESGKAWRGFDPSKKNRHWAVPGFLLQQMPSEFAELGVLDKLEGLYKAGLIDIIDGAAWPTPVRYLNEESGQPIQDIWAFQPYTEGTVFGTKNGIDEDVKWLGPTDPERLGYQTQKPRGLMERIIQSSCPENGVVLDPFCGCGTTIDAAIHLKRSWIGIDITYLAIDLIRKRLFYTYGATIESTYRTAGIPEDKEGARALFLSNAFDFERWAVSLVDGQPNEKQVGDKGVDGRARFYAEEKRIGQVLISVKGGDNLNPSMVRDLAGTVEHERAEMGMLLTLETPTRGMLEAANRSGTYTAPLTGQTYPRIQVLTVSDLLQKKRPNLPTVILPYIKAAPRARLQTKLL
jgi:DNA modification methylase